MSIAKNGAVHRRKRIQGEWMLDACNRRNRDIQKEGGIITRRGGGIARGWTGAASADALIQMFKPNGWEPDGMEVRWVEYCNGRVR